MNNQIYTICLMISLMCWSYQTSTAQCASGQFTKFTGASPTGSCGATSYTGSVCDLADCTTELCIEVCFDLETFVEVVGSTVHGVAINNLPAGASIAPGSTGIQGTADGGPGLWNYFVSGVPNPGYYVDSDDNGDPSDNLGDAGDGDCDLACIENFTLDPFCFIITFPPGSCGTGTYSPTIKVYDDFLTGSGSVPTECTVLQNFVGQNPADEMGPNCDGDLYFKDASNPSPANDNIFNAISLDAEITAALASPVGWSCDATARLFSSPSLSPTMCPLADESGANVCDNSVKNDIWYSFTGGSNVWIDFYQDPDNADNLVLALYEGTPSLSCALDGLTYIACADGDLGLGGPRDKGNCTTPLSERIDVSGLTSGTTYYLRLWQLGSTLSSTDAKFYICVESSTPKAPAVDNCLDFPVVNEPTIGCLDGIPDRNVIDALSNLSNTGASGVTASGNACDATNGAVALSTVTYVDYACDGTFTNLAGTTNTVVNNNVFYSFSVNGSANCAAEADVIITFDNIDICCGATDLQIAVTSPTCGSATAVMAVNVNPNDPLEGDCVEIRPYATGVLPNGLYFISVEGQNGALVSFDMVLEVTYSIGVDCIPSDCGVPLPVELMHFSGSPEAQYNYLEWSTSSEEGTEWFVVERSEDGKNFKELDRVAASGTTTNARHYHLKDLQPDALSYYRLKAVDYDGYFEYSEVIAIRRKSELLSGLKVYPMPIVDQFTLQFQMHHSIPVDIKIWDAAGVLVKSEMVDQTVSGINNVSIDLSGYHDGLYFITLHNGEEKLYQKIFKGQY